MAFMLYDFCNFLYRECWEKITYPIQIMRTRSLPTIVNREGMIWNQPTFQRESPISSEDDWDFVEIFKKNRN
jgi:hypothetical protein